MSGPPVLPPACTPYGEAGEGRYGYQPGLGVGIAFTIIFGVIAVTHAYQTFRYRTLWLLFFVVGAGLECLGWIARTVAHNCAYSITLSTMQVAVLIMGPAWTQAGIYITLWVFITILGRHVSPLPPKTYLIICVCCDIVCLALQATGGGLAGSAFSKGSSTQPGTTTMVVGIIAQLVLTCLFSIILTIVFVRGAPQIRANKPLLYVSAATALSAAMMVTRGVYRSIELSQGWRGFLILNEGYLIALDAVPMLIAMGIFNVFNPAALFNKQKALTEKDAESNLPSP